MMKIFVAYILSALLFSFTISNAVAQTVSVEVAGTERDQKYCIVSIPLPEYLQELGAITVSEEATSKQLPVQIDRTGQTPRVVWIIENLKAKSTRRYQITGPSPRKIPLPEVIVEDDSKHLNIRFGNKKVLTYNHALVKSPIPDAPYYERSGYIHPVYSPNGEIVTDDFNPDHAHQHGIMFAWRKMKFKGRVFDPWNQKAKLGRVEHVKINSKGSGQVFGHFSVSLKHIDLTGPDGEEAVLDEIWNVKVFAVGESFLFDLTSTQTCATQTPVHVEKIHYGGMAFRGRADWFDNQSFDYITSEGKTKKDGNHSKPHWVNISGPVTDGFAGVTIFSHTNNFRSPQHVRLHPKMPYFCFPPSVDEAFTITPGKPYISRYRFHVHSGKYDKELSQSVFESFSQTPTVKIISK